MRRSNNDARNPLRRGSAYLIVLGVCLIASVLAYSGLSVTRTKQRIAGEIGDTIAARQHAESAMELARLWIRQEANWRTTRPHGAWVTDQPIGSGTFSIEATDPADGSFPNHDHDAVIVKATGKQGNSRHVMQVTLAAQGVPLPALAYAVHVAGEIQLPSSKTITATGGGVSTNGTLKNNGTIIGNASFQTASSLGTITGTVTPLAGTKAFPPSDVPDRYAARASLLSSSANFDKQVLTPSFNPWGATNVDGVYVIRPSGDLSLKNCRIHGTLIVQLNTDRKVLIDNNVFLHPYRADYPTLIIQGNADFNFQSGSSTLSESALGTNFNRSGAPYNGITDGAADDSYPSEIQGLVHITGNLVWRSTGRVRGLVLCEQTGIQAVKIDDTVEAIYTPGLFTSPPQWYTTDVKMVPQTGSWRQVAN